jgi:hypothetical protein
MVDTVTDWHSETLYKCYCHNTARYSKRRKNVLFILIQIYSIKLTLNIWRREMKSYDELKAEMEAIQQQMVEAKKSERANALKEVKRLCKEFGFTAGMLKGSLAEGRKKS